MEIEGVSGPGSVLALHGSWLDVLSFGIQYLHPLSPQSFITAQTEIKLEKDITVSGLQVKNAVENRLFIITGEILGGFLINKHNTINAAVRFFSNPQDYPVIYDQRKTVLGFSASYTFNSLDYHFLPSRGIFANLENRFCLPLPAGDPQFFNILSLEIQGIIPLSRKFGIVAGAFAGSDLSSNLSQLKGLPAGFSAFDRQYFPNISGADNYYPNMAAASVAVQFLPWENLTILGGQLIVSFSAAAGQLLNEWKDFAFNKLMWNASLNIGLRFLNNFGVLLRIGAGSNSTYPVMPFLAFDIGQIKKSGIKP
jgi:NTE family protein